MANALFAVVCVCWPLHERAVCRGGCGCRRRACCFLTPLLSRRMGCYHGLRNSTPPPRNGNHGAGGAWLDGGMDGARDDAVVDPDGLGDYPRGVEAIVSDRRAGKEEGEKRRINQRVHVVSLSQAHARTPSGAELVDGRWMMTSDYPSSNRQLSIAIVTPSSHPALCPGNWKITARRSGRLEYEDVASKPLLRPSLQPVFSSSWLQLSSA